MTAALEMHLPRTGAASVFTPRDITLSAPGPGEALVAVEATGVAYADIVIRQGLYPGARPPVTPGYDFVGRIEALGPGVSGFVLGQRVAALTVTGSYATRRLVPAGILVPAPEGVAAAKLAAGVLNGLTAYQMFRRVALAAPHETVLVHGAAGGVGTFLLDFARLYGVRAIGTASAGKRATVEARGAAHIDYASEAVAERARALSGGGVVAAYDHIGGAHLKQVSMASLRPGGTTVLYGVYDATKGGRTNPLALFDIVAHASMNIFAMFGRSQGAVGYNVASWRDGRPEAYRTDLAVVLGMIGDGRIDPLIGATFPLGEVAKAHEALERAAVSGKIVLIP